MIKNEPQWQFDAGAAPPAFAQYPDLSAAAHFGSVDRQPHYRPVLSLGAVGLVIWLSAAAAGPQSLCRRSERDRVLGRPGRTVRLHFCLLSASVRRHPASRLGYGSRLRASVDLRFGMGGRGGEHRAHRGGLDASLFVAVWRHESPTFRSPLARAIGLGSAKSGVDIGGRNASQRSRLCR